MADDSAHNNTYNNTQTTPQKRKEQQTPEKKGFLLPHPPATCVVVLSPQVQLQPLNTIDWLAFTADRKSHRFTSPHTHHLTSSTLSTHTHRPDVFPTPRRSAASRDVIRGDTEDRVECSTGRSVRRTHYNTTYTRNTTCTLLTYLSLLPSLLLFPQSLAFFLGSSFHLVVPHPTLRLVRLDSIFHRTSLHRIVGWSKAILYESLSYDTSLCTCILVT